MSAFDRLHRIGGRYPRTRDTAVAAALLTITLVTTATGPAQLRGSLSVGATIAAGIAYGALPFRRASPWAALVFAGAGAETYVALSHPGVGVYAAPMIALYTVADSASSRRMHVAVGVVIILSLAGIHAMMRPYPWLGTENLMLAALCGLAVSAGDASRSRRAYISEVEERARRSEHEREQEARRRVTEERLRIARDLHDMMGHRIAVIRMQANVVDHVFDSSPHQARQAVRQIKTESLAALDDLKDTIGLLRQYDDLAMPVEPVAGLAELSSLIATFTDSGIKVNQVISGTERPIPPSVGLITYRVIQEALTNVSKHTTQATATIALDYEETALRITVEDDGGLAGQPASTTGEGHGITGMRERVTAADGYVDVGPKPGVGFRVTAVLPTSVRAGSNVT
jgi:signal transduction histidine kinase